MKLKSLLVISVSSLLLTSCLKSRDSLGVHGDSGSIVSEIYDINYYGDPKAIALEANPPTETFNLVTLRSYSPRSNKPSGNKVHAKLTIDNSLVTAAGLTPLPTNAYTIPSLEFDIPADGEVTVPMTLNKGLLDLSQSYGIGLKLTQVSSGVVSDLAKQIVVNVLVKNKYDGMYKGNGYALRAGDATLTGNFTGWTVGLATTGSNSVIFDRAQVWGDGQSGIAIGNPALSIDPTTNAVTISSSGGASNLPGYNSHYDPATKTFYIGMTWGAGPSARQAIDTITYTGPR